MSNSLRILIDAATDGARNMAIDELLLHAVGRGLAGPTLRLYRWERATLSLGYAQKLSGLDDEPLLVRSMPLVRRMTGGGAILHERELTYCLALPLDAGASPVGEVFGVAAPAAEMYARMHGFLAQAVESLGRQGSAGAEGSCRPGTARRLDYSAPESSSGGARPTGLADNARLTLRDCAIDAGKPARPTDCAVDTDKPAGKAFLCFERHSKLDLMMAGDKLAGSAQRRSKHVVIQQGSLVLRSHPAQPSQAVERIAGRHIMFEEMASVLLSVLRSSGLGLEHGQLSQRESVLLPDLLEKYQSDEWLRRVM